MDKEFKLLLEKHKGSIVRLENRNRIPVAALYLDKLNYENIVISETNTREKYYLYINGVAILFSYFVFTDELN